jgi:PilZ domain
MQDEADATSVPVKDVPTDGPANMSAENRKNPRREIQRQVSISVSMPAVLHDISILGARLSIDDPARLPDSFKLELSPKLHRWCRVAWRSEKEIGVEFVNAPTTESHTSGTSAAPSQMSVNDGHPTISDQ